jgi:hypothetical protein
MKRTQKKNNILTPANFSGTGLNVSGAFYKFTLTRIA